MTDALHNDTGPLRGPAPTTRQGTSHLWWAGGLGRRQKKTTILVLQIAVIGAESRTEITVSAVMRYSAKTCDVSTLESIGRRRSNCQASQATPDKMVKMDRALISALTAPQERPPLPDTGERRRGFALSGNAPRSCSGLATAPMSLLVPKKKMQTVIHPCGQASRGREPGPGGATSCEKASKAICDAVKLAAGHAGVITIQMG
jgi:hypothetical protein